MNPSTTMGRYPLSTRLTSICRFATIAYPPREQLSSVYTAMLKAVPGLQASREFAASGNATAFARLKR